MEFIENNGEWTAIDYTTYVYLDNAHANSTFNSERPYVVATTDGGEPTGETGEYETFPTLRAALARASFRHVEILSRR